MTTPQTPTPITDHTVVALTWVMKDMQGEVLDTLDAPVEFLVGGDDLLESIDHALQHHAVGDTFHLHIEPEQGFGDYDEQKVFLEPRKLFPAELEEGMAFDGHALPAGITTAMPADALYIVTDIYPEHVVLDANHPLAGIGLELEIKIHSARAATEAEIGRGSAGVGFFRVEAQTPGNGTVH